MDRHQLGLQLYTLRAQTAEDMLGSLRSVAELGYRAVEFAGFGGVSPSRIRTTLDELGLRALGAHIPYASFEMDLQRVVDDLLMLGCEFAIVPILPAEMRDDPRTVDVLGERLEAWASTVGRAGLRFAYHNHAFEFARLAGHTIFEALLATDPALVHLELDVFWAQFAGEDPVTLIQAHGHRIALLHLKDLDPSRDPSTVPVGDGVLDWPSILTAAEAAGVRWYSVEQDHSADPLRDVTRSLGHLEPFLSNA